MMACMSTPQNGVVAYSQSHVSRSLFARVVSRCLPWGFRLPECPSAMGIHIILDGARICLQKGRPPSGCWTLTLFSSRFRTVGQLNSCWARVAFSYTTNLVDINKKKLWQCFWRLHLKTPHWGSSLDPANWFSHSVWSTIVKAHQFLPKRR